MDDLPARLVEAAAAGSAFWGAMRSGDDAAVLALISAGGLRQVTGGIPTTSVILDKMELTAEEMADLGLVGEADLLDDGSFVLRYGHEGFYPVGQSLTVWMLVASQERDRWRVDPFGEGQGRAVVMSVAFTSPVFGPLPERPPDA